MGGHISLPTYRPFGSQLRPTKALAECPSMVAPYPRRLRVASASGVAKPHALCPPAKGKVRVRLNETLGDHFASALICRMTISSPSCGLFCCLIPDSVGLRGTRRMASPYLHTQRDNTFKLSCLGVSPKHPRVDSGLVPRRVLPGGTPSSKRQTPYQTSYTAMRVQEEPVTSGFGMRLKNGPLSCEILANLPAPLAGTIRWHTDNSWRVKI